MSATQETATLGGGCFWCLEAVFKDLRGVTWVMSGYAGGQTANPSYKAVCSGRTGHAEVVQVKFDPSQLAYADLLRVFFTIHDPTTQDRQGNDVGSQYRSIILTHSEEQAEVARTVMREITEAKIWSGKLVTQIEPLTVFYEARGRTPRLFRPQSLERVLPGRRRAESRQVPQAIRRSVETRSRRIDQAGSGGCGVRHHPGGGRSAHN